MIRERVLAARAIRARNSAKAFRRTPFNCNAELPANAVREYSEETILPEHVAEAINYRSLERLDTRAA